MNTKEGPEYDASLVCLRKRTKAEVGAPKTKCGKR